MGAIEDHILKYILKQPGETVWNYVYTRIPGAVIGVFLGDYAAKRYHYLTHPENVPACSCTCQCEKCTRNVPVCSCTCECKKCKA